MQKTIIIPTTCLGCGAARAGVQDGAAVYECGTTLREDSGRMVVLRSPSAIAGLWRG